MEFLLLGPVELRVDGRPVPLGGPRQRGVIAALAVDAGTTVSVEALVDRVWGEAPPPRVRHTLQAYIARLRRLVPAQVTRRSGGYALEVDPECIDMHRFRRLVCDARDPRCPDRERVVMLDRALDLWRGSPLADLPGEWPARARLGWQQQYLDAALIWVASCLRHGSPAIVLARLTDLAAEHPMVESVTAALMRALYLDGRPSDALRHHDRIRRQLAEELGADPGLELQQLHRQILTADPALRSPALITVGPHGERMRLAAASPNEQAGLTTVGNEGPRRPRSTPDQPTAQVPRQLPADVVGFTGRTQQLRQMDSILMPGAVPAARAVMAIAGTAGAGKTALAVHWAQRVADLFPDGQLHLNLRGYDPSRIPVAPAAGIRHLLDALGVPSDRIPADVDTQAALYRGLLAGRRMLVVLDNARDADQVRPLLPGAPGCVTVVTSRDELLSLIAIEGAHALTLDLMSIAEARQMLTARLGTERVAAEPGAVDAIITHCARLPLALAIAAGRAALRPDFPLAVLADDLSDTRQRLDVLAVADTRADLRAVFSWSYRCVSPGAARLFRLLGLHPGPDVGIPAAASLAGIPVTDARRLLTELTRAHLVVEHRSCRYTFHDLIRAYATEHVGSVDTDTERQAATHRMLDHYLHTAHAVDGLLNPHREPLILTPPRPGVILEAPSTDGQALIWLTTEHRILIGAVEHAAAQGFDTHTWQLSWMLEKYLYRQGYWREQLTTNRAAVAAADRLAVPAVQSRAYRSLSRTHLQLGAHDEAHSHLRHALNLGVQADHRAEQADTHQVLSWVLERLGRHTDAFHHIRQALHLYRAEGDRAGEAYALNTIGWFHALLGNHHAALTYCHRALHLHQKLNRRDGQADAWHTLGYAHHHLNQITQALTCYQSALNIFRDSGDTYYRGATLHGIGDAHHAAGNLNAARENWAQALIILSDLAHPDADRVRTKLAQQCPPGSAVVTPLSQDTEDHSP